MFHKGSYASWSNFLTMIQLWETIAQSPRSLMVPVNPQLRWLPQKPSLPLPRGAKTSWHFPEWGSWQDIWAFSLWKVWAYMLQLYNEATLCVCVVFLGGFTFLTVWAKVGAEPTNKAITFPKTTFSTMQSFFRAFLTARTVIWVDLKGKVETESCFWKPENHTLKHGQLKKRS